VSRATAERWVVISAVVTLGIYAYRRFAGGPQTFAITGNLANLVSQKPPPPLGQFATAWGFVYLIIAVMAEAAPGLGGGFAILVMTGDLLANTGNVIAEVQQQQQPQQQQQQQQQPTTAATTAAPGSARTAAQTRSSARIAGTVHYVPGTAAGGAAAGTGRF
jgi:predicted membrane-bound mannosyltransferase